MPKTQEMNFTQKCILMSIVAKEKNLVLVNSFNNIPFVKLYTAKQDNEIFIYSKIKGALCLFARKDPNKKLFCLRIYNIDNYSVVFNMELQKDHLKYFTQYNDDFYYMQLRESLLGFKFNSRQSGKNFHNILKEEPKIEVLEQNEKSMSIKSKDISKTINKVNETIKLKIKNTFQIVQTKGGGGWFGKKEDNFPHMVINDKKGEFFDLSMIPKMYFFLKNVEISDKLYKMVIFSDNNLPKNQCQKYVLKYDKYFDFNSKTSPLKIIEKDFINILDKKIYINILVNNMINDMKMNERLNIFKKEHIKRSKKKGANKLSSKRGIRPFHLKKTTSSKHLSRVGSESSMLEGYYSDNNENRSSIVSDSGLSSLTNNNNNNKPKVINKDKYSNDRKSISELTYTAFDNIIDSDEDSDKNEAGFKYFEEDKKKKSVQNQKKAPTQKTLKKSISSDYILGDKDKSKKDKKKAEDLMNFLGGDSVAIPEIDEDEGENKNIIINKGNSKQMNSTLYFNKNFKNKVNMSSKTSLTGFLMATNKLAKNKK